MAKWEHNLPAVLIPDGEICVTVKIPNHPDYVKLFLRAVRMLETNRLYQRDEGLSAKVVVEQWRNRTITPLIEALATGNGCPEDMKQFACNSYPAFASFIKYFPDNPYIDGEEVPEGYLLPAWWIWGSLETILPDYIDDIFNGLLEDFTGYKPKDALTWLGSLPISLSWEDFFDIGGIFPRIEIEVTGMGQAKIEFLSFPAGGRVIVELDQMPNIFDILDGGFLDPNSSAIDTDRDIASFPPEENVINIIPVDIETDGDHTIYCVFLPLINDSVLPIGFGGGLRGVELCGGLRPRGTPEPEPPPPLEGVTELIPVFKFTPDCGLEVRLLNQDGDIYEDFKPVEGWIDNASACFTPEGGGDVATIEDIREAIDLAAQDISQAILQGFLAEPSKDVKIGFDGAVDVSVPGQVPNDPSTDADEKAKAGGVIAIRTGLTGILTELNAWYGADAAADIISTLAGFRINSKYKIDSSATMQTGIDSYWAYLGGGGAKLTTWGANFDASLYCAGREKEDIVGYIISSISGVYHDFLINLINSMSEAQLEGWYGKGSYFPSTNYVGYDCTPIIQESFVLNMATANFVQYTTTGVWKKSHRFRIQITGTFTDSDNPGIVYDGMYKIVTATGVKTYWPIVLGFSGVPVNPDGANIPYSPANVYDFTVDVSTTATNGTGTIGKDNGDFNLPNTVGTLSFIVTDLGQYI